MHQSYACFTENKSIIPEGLLCRDYGLVFNKAKYPQNFVTNHNAVIFAGFLFKHYGHFLLESTARLWFAKMHPELAICFVGRDGLILDFQEAIFKLLGLKNQILFVDQPVQFSKCYFPSPGFISRGYLYQWHAAFLGQYTAQSASGKPLYLSRRQFGGISCLKNEAEIEKALIKKGFEIFYPEQYPIEEQLKMLGAAPTILALEGSALHSLLLLQNVQAKVIVIPRPNQLANSNYLAIANAKGFEQAYLPLQDLYTDITPVSHVHVDYQAHLKVAHLVRYLESPSFAPYHPYSHIYLTEPNLAWQVKDPQKETLAKLTTANAGLKAQVATLTHEKLKLKALLAKALKEERS